MQPTESEFDPTQYELNDTGILTVQNAKLTDDLIGADKTNPVTIVIYSPGSRQGVKALHAAVRNATALTQQFVHGRPAKNRGSEMDEERVEKLVLITAEIRNFPYPGGAEALYANPKLFYIADQVEAFFNDKANFSKPSTPSSVSTSGTQPG